MINNNSVAFIAKIKSIAPIPNADNIELITVNRWTSTCQKGIHKEGDLVLCITTDAVIPEELAVKWGVFNYLRKGNRVRTIKLKGVYSECILISAASNELIYSQEGDDLMEQLGIYKYEPLPIIIQDNKGKKHRYHQNPNFHIYHKFPNHKNVPNMFNEGDMVQVSRKLHGTNARYGIVKKSKLSILDKIKRFFGNKWVEYEYVYGSHNVEKDSDSQGFYSTDVWKTVAIENSIESKLWEYVKTLPKAIIGNGLIIYGEIYGPGIQGVDYHYNLIGPGFAIFDIKLDNEYIDTVFINHVCNKLNIPQIEILQTSEYNYDVFYELFVVNSYIENTKVPHEGIVIKSITGDRAKIAKVINPDYLIYSEKHHVPDSH